MKKLDLVILADRDSSVSRAYLTYLKAHGYKPEKILLVDFIGKSTKSKILSAIFGKRATAFIVKWYKKLGQYRTEGNRWKKLARYMDSCFDCSVNYFGRFRYQKYAEEVESIIATGFDDQLLLRKVQDSNFKTMLFTGGGRVAPELLNLPGIRLLHIHPGIVPDIKGADGILWSVLLKKKLGYSGFYMNEGIDTGGIVIKREYPLPGFSKKECLNKFSYDEMYKALLYSFDAHMRAQTLVDLLQISEKSQEALNELSCEVQDVKKGRVYFFMHPLLRDAALESMCE